MFYEENTSQIDNYSGGNMTINAQPSAILSISASLSSTLTGQINDKFEIVGSTPYQVPIA